MPKKTGKTLAKDAGQQRLTIEDILVGVTEELSAKQKILISFLHRNYQKVAFVNITDLARETKVSEATIVRLATLLGFEGYPSLQRAVRRIVSQELTTLQRMQLSLDNQELDDPSELVMKLDIRNIMRLFRNVSRKDIDDAVTRILDAENVIVAGIMASAPLAIYFGYSLTRVRRNVRWIVEDGLALKQAVLGLGHRDLLIGFAFPRYPASIVALTRVASERGTGRLIFTDTSASPLTRYADSCIFMPVEALSFVDSLAGQISFLAGLISEMVKRHPKQTAQCLAEFETLTSVFALFHHD